MSVLSVKKTFITVITTRDLEENVSGKLLLLGEDVTKDWDRDKRKKHSRQSYDQAASIEKLPRTSRCTQCKGLGVEKGTDNPCGACKGVGGIYLGNI